MLSVVYLKWLKGNAHPINVFAFSFLSLNSTLATMITYFIPIISISPLQMDTLCPTQNHPPFQKSLAQTPQRHSHFHMSPIHIAHSTTLWSSSIPFIVHPIDLNHLHKPSLLSWTLSQHPSFTSISATTNNTTSLYLHNHIPFHISLAQTLHSPLSTYSSPCTLWIWM